MRDPLGPNALPDKVDGTVLFPGWIQDYGFYGGGRHFHQEVGPIPYFLIVRDETPLADTPRVAWGQITRLGQRLTIPIMVEDVSDDPMTAEFYFDLGVAHHVHELLLIVATGVIRLALARLSDDSKLEMEYSLWLSLPVEALEPVKHID
jgi:hypothetical protein